VSKSRINIIKAVGLLGLALLVLSMLSRFVEDSAFLNAFHSLDALGMVLALSSSAVLMNISQKEKKGSK
jgi:hypothetical protein